MVEKPLLSDEKLKKIFHATARALPDNRRVPVATYRLQLNHGFTFSDARSIVPYLYDLGISDCYVSPYFRAQKGSLHGYDIEDHNMLNPEIGTEEDYNRWTEELKKYGMGQVLDIVPNHMNIGGNENPWWMDVLENGPSSLYGDFFDIDWSPVKEELEGKVLIPVLGDQYGLVLENQELTLTFEEGALFIHYYDRKFPVAPISYTKVLKFRIGELEKKLGKEHPHLLELLSISTAIDHLPPRTEKVREKIVERRREKEIIKKRLWNLYTESGEIRSFVDENVRFFNGERGNPKSFDLLDELLCEQAYRLSHWRVATDEINYRRFFDINELASIRMEDPRVFREAHRLTFRLIREGKVTGLRVDHPDGLYNPAEYFYRLQKNSFVQFCLSRLPSAPEESDAGKKLGSLYDEMIALNPSSLLRMSLYIVGEKILTKGERMPEDWPIFSTTGYVFLNSVSGIFVDMKNARFFDRIYSRLIRSQTDYPDLVYEKKKLFMLTSMSSEINTLGHYLNRLSEKNRHTRDFTLNSLTTAIVEVIANFPVYRTYVTASGVNERDQRYIEQAVSRAMRRNPALSATIFDFLKDVLLLRYPEHFTETDKAEWIDFVMRFQQNTSPIMAKGVEDTAFYVYNRFVSLNEVGGNPDRFGTSLDTFHGQNIERTKFWPYAMIATSTHDTKRSEDVRARLNVLSEIPGEWRETVFRWSRINRKKKTRVEGQWVPDRNEEYLIYQALLGAWPVHPMDEGGYDLFKKRIEGYALKAIREAKVNTSWISPNIPYEEGVLKFIDAILRRDGPFLKDFLPFQKRVAYFGMFNALSQALLKMTSPGIPDFFQGTEIWDFSLVDPDNRRPVDFSLRKEMLRNLKERTAVATSELPRLTRDLLREWEDGAAKLYVTWKALKYRKGNDRLFLDGVYIPLVTEGSFEEHVCAFARQGDGKTVLVIVPRFLTRLVRSTDELPLGREVWADARIVLPDEIAEDEFYNIFTGETVKRVLQGGNRVFALSELLSHFPVAMLSSLPVPP
jgi:(1->4)-alpha-D-glucan 1-alpha-D-glucosylmutase